MRDKVECGSEIKVCVLKKSESLYTPRCLDRRHLSKNEKRGDRVLGYKNATCTGRESESESIYLPPTHHSFPSTPQTAARFASSTYTLTSYSLSALRPKRLSASSRRTSMHPSMPRTPPCTPHKQPPYNTTTCSHQLAQTALTTSLLLAHTDYLDLNTSLLLVHTDVLDRRL